MTPALIRKATEDGGKEIYELRLLMPVTLLPSNANT